MTKLIVELCQNHTGNKEILGEMIRLAAKNGADYVKIQSIFSKDLTKRERFENGEIDENGSIKTIKRPYDAELERLAKLDLSLSDHLYFIEKCKEYNVIPLTTIFARHRIPEIASLPWPVKVVKVASYDCPSFPMLSELADYFDHLIVSTGASFNEEIEKAVEIIKNKGKKITLLHCVTSYPNTLEMCNLKRMEYLKELTDEIGWSDHTLVERDDILAAKVAILLGADFIERHFTILEKDETKDGPVSIKPEHLANLDEFRKLTYEEQLQHLDSLYPHWKITVGDKHREMTITEILNRDYYKGRFGSPKDNGWKYNWEE